MLKNNLRKKIQNINYILFKFVDESRACCMQYICIYIVNHDKNAKCAKSYTIVAFQLSVSRQAFCPANGGSCITEEYVQRPVTRAGRTRHMSVGPAPLPLPLAWEPHPPPAYGRIIVQMSGRVRRWSAAATHNSFGPTRTHTHNRWQLLHRNNVIYRRNRGQIRRAKRRRRW